MILPRLDLRLCTACGDCVRLCPTACLAIAGQPWLAVPRDCVACGLCELACPTGAIILAEANLSGLPSVLPVENRRRVPKIP